jgi:hypothetical protein
MGCNIIILAEYIIKNLQNGLTFIYPTTLEER